MLTAAQPFTYVDHGHVTTGAVIAGLGVLGLLVGLVRRIILVGVIAAVLLLAGVVTFSIALHGTHCTPTSHKQVCLSVH